MSSNGTGALTMLQLEVICHLCNGLTLTEVADKMNYSLSNVKDHLRRAKRNTGAKTTTHLASIVIASGVLVWNDEGERMPGAGLPGPSRNPAPVSS